MKLLKERIQNGDSMLGPFMYLCQPAIMEIAGLAGFDFAIIDTEHGEISSDRAVDMVRAAKLSGISPVVRVYCNQPELIAKALDIGAEGVQIPQVCTKEGAVAAVSAAKFSPLGARGSNPYVRAAKYSAMNKLTYFKNANDAITVIIQVEGKEGVDNLTEILSVPGIDVLFIGPYDLSASLGVPGQVDHPLLLDEMKKIMALAKQAGVALGIFVDDVQSAVKWKNAGIQYISFSGDVGLLYETFCKKIKVFQGIK